MPTTVEEAVKRFKADKAKVAPKDTKVAKAVANFQSDISDPSEESFLKKLKIPATTGLLLGPAGQALETLGAAVTGKKPETSDFDLESGLQATAQAGGSLAGAVAGATVGQPILGSIGGFGIGTALMEGARSLAPSIFGQPRSSEEVAQDIGINAGLDVVTAGLSKLPGARKLISDKILSLVKGKPLSPKAVAAVKALEKRPEVVDPNFMGPVPNIKMPNMTVGIRGNSAAAVMEDVLTTKQKNVIVENVQETIKDKLQKETGLQFSALPIPGELGKEGQRHAQANLLRLAAKENQAWGLFRSQAGTVNIAEPIFELDAQGKQVLKGIEAVAVEAPVYLKETVFVGKKIKHQLEAVLGRAIANEGDQSVKGMYSDVLTKVRNLVQPMKHVDTNGKVVDINIASYRKLQDTVKDIWDTLPNKIKVDRAGGYLKQLQSAITKDMADAYPTNTLAGQSLDVAKGLTKQKSRMFPEQVQKAIEGNSSQFFQKIMASPEEAALFRNAVVGRELTRREIATNPQAKEATAELLSRFLNNHTDEVTGQLDVQKALNSFTSREYRGLTRELLTARQRANIEHLLRVASETTGNIGMTGKVALEIRKTGAMINIGTGLAGAIAGGGYAAGLNVVTGPATGLVGLVFAGKKYTKDVLLDPTQARRMAGLMKMDPKTPVAKKETLKLLKALKGAEFLMIANDANGKEYEAGRGIVPNVLPSDLVSGTVK